ncbi:hypothetical protein HNQ36_005057 [Afipia massiliensis]|uniref:Transposase n=1 Tax=Afipia massiliensis TaxID=211460 RepID=A0A840NED2_9BRAD|nr:hypothetical protein [Afipia massiliensis]MBB5055046.1 hypothetical protein [Afipia massiliensis]
MIGLLCFVLASPFKSKIRLEAENAALRYRLIVLRRKLRGRVQPANNDRWLFVQLYRWFPSILKVLTIIRPDLPDALDAGLERTDVPFKDGNAGVCIENLIRVDDVMESPKLAE